MTIEDKAQAYDTAIRKAQDIFHTSEFIKITDLFPELRENEDESLKNKSGYYKAGKFWKASTLWNATKNKIPQRVSNRYILQECTWNIGNLQDFANEVKNVQEVSLDYPIILDMNGNIIDGAHRVVKAYLEGKDIDIVYIGDDEWPEPDYDEEKAVKESEDERIRKHIVKFIDEQYPTHGNLKEEKDKMLAYLEKQKEQKPVPISCGHENGFMSKEWSEEDKKMLNHLIDKIQENWHIRMPNGHYFGISNDEKETFSSWLRHLPERFNLSLKQEWSEEDEKMIESICRSINEESIAEGLKCHGKSYSINELSKLQIKMTNFLKSINQKLNSFSWKPSEEQMEALDKARFFIPYDCNVIAELYEQLQKL